MASRHKIVWNLCEHCKKPFQTKRVNLRKGQGRFCSDFCRHAARYPDMAGQRFGRLEVVSRHGNKGKLRQWKCRCDCGNITFATSTILNTGQKLSCGCLQSERAAEYHTTHGMRHTRLSRIWRGMKTRCYTPSSTSYKYYGARGVKVCDEWQKFEPFMKWALANGYEEHLEVDRIDNYGDYCPDNCRIVTKSENMRNSRRAQDLREQKSAVI